jgi:fructose-1,6-bisphosphatase I
MESEITLKQHLKSLPDDLASLIDAFSMISLNMQTQFPKYLSGIKNDPNKYGEAVAKLDDFTNGYLCDNLIQTALVRKIYSEELAIPLTYNNKAPFVITLDPLDGSSNIASNNPLGTILGIYRNDLPQTGKHLVAAVYKLYGPVNTLVYSAGKGTHEFVKHYDSEGNAKFLLLHENMRIPATGGVFGIGGDPLDWEGKFLKFAKDLFRVHKLKTRYSGTFVADFSQILHSGGMFAYPQSKKFPGGKLRLFYEAQPMAYLMENSGGASWNGNNASLLETKSSDADSRVPVYVGSKKYVDAVKKALS